MHRLNISAEIEMLSMKKFLQTHPPITLTIGDFSRFIFTRIDPELDPRVLFTAGLSTTKT
jgi:hypothetical protein